MLAEAPGRVNLIGEHTDYNGGFVLPVAIDRTVVVAAALRDDSTVRVKSLDFDACDEFRADAPRRTGRREWRDYVRGVAWALLDAGFPLRGADIAIVGDVPQGAGLSSSAALEVAVAGAFSSVSKLTIARRDLAGLCQRAENYFVGVHCGVMDQLAAAHGRAGHALLIDCASLDTRPVPLPPPQEALIVVVDSKAPRELGATAYNERRAECQAAAEALGVPSLRDADAETLEAHADTLPEAMFRRARHVISENGRVLRLVSALENGDLEAVGALMYESHFSLRDDFEVSTPRLDLLVALAQKTSGVIGSRLTGAGFGGCTVTLLRPESVADFESGVVHEYRARTGLEAEMHVCRAVDGLQVRDA